MNDRCENFLWLFPDQQPVLCLEGYGVCVFPIPGAPEGSIDSGSGEAGDQTPDIWLKKLSTTPWRNLPDCVGN